MRYRIKDPDVVKAFKILGWTYEFDEADVERFGFYWHGDCRNKIYFDPCEEFYVEPVKELAEGWHPYPDEKPEKADELYLVAYKGNDGREHIDTRWFNGKVFDFWISDIFAWREMLEIWKEEK